MATIRQKKLAKVIVENSILDKPLNAGQMLEKVGYAPSVAKHKPAQIINQEGVKEELEILGFDPDTAKSVVAAILTNAEKDTDRLKAAEMVFKVHGSFAAEKHVNLNISREENPKLDELIARIEHGLDNPQG